MRNAPPEHLYRDRHPSPVGEILLVTDEMGALRALDFADYETRMLKLLKRHYGEQALEKGPAPKPIHDALTSYFAGDAAALEGLTWKTNGTEFQRTVWNALTTIPAGATWSYRQLAEKIGKPKAVRAVGLANGANPVGVVVPCHRVIGANGSLTGYGGGLERKRWLLEHEARAV